MEKLTLDRPAAYQIKVPGIVDFRWSDWDDEMIVVNGYEYDQPFTLLSGTFDQAALHGMLRRLYALGLPIISVICLDV